MWEILMDTFDLHGSGANWRQGTTEKEPCRLLTEDGSSKGRGRSSNGVMTTIIGLHITAKSASNSLALMPIATWTSEWDGGQCLSSDVAIDAGVGPIRQPLNGAGGSATRGWLLLTPLVSALRFVGGCLANWLRRRRTLRVCYVRLRLGPSRHTPRHLLGAWLSASLEIFRYSVLYTACIFNHRKIPRLISRLLLSEIV